MINDLLKDVKQLEDVSSDYWIKSDKNNDLKPKEIQIRGLTFSIAGYEELVETLFYRHLSSYNEKIDALLMACTGGDFETKNRQSNPARAVAVRECAANVASIARKARKDSASMKALYWEAKRIMLRFNSSLCQKLDSLTSNLMRPFIFLHGKIFPLF